MSDVFLVSSKSHETYFFDRKLKEFHSTAKAFQCSELMTRAELGSQSLLTIASCATLALLTLASISPVLDVVMDIAAKRVVQPVLSPVDEGTFAGHCAGTGKFRIEGRRQGFVRFDDGIQRLLGHYWIFRNHRFDRLDRFLGFFRLVGLL